MGDMLIYVGGYFVDVWVNRWMFELDFKIGVLVMLSGVFLDVFLKIG